MKKTEKIKIVLDGIESGKIKSFFSNSLFEYVVYDVKSYIEGLIKKEHPKSGNSNIIYTTEVKKLFLRSVYNFDGKYFSIDLFVNQSISNDYLLMIIKETFKWVIENKKDLYNEILKQNDLDMKRMNIDVDNMRGELQDNIDSLDEIINNIEDVFYGDTI